MSGNSPIFICGALRSGTTMLRLMVDHHPQLSNFGETDFLFEYLASENGDIDTDEFRERLREDAFFKEFGLRLPETNDIHEFIRALVDQMRLEERILTINLHRNFARIPETFPDAKVIHLLRDPRDVARSAIGMGWAGNVFFGVNHWMLSEQSMERLRTRFPNTEVLTVRNEDLVRDAEVVLTRICAFIGVPYDPAMLDYHKNSTYEPPDPSLVEQWRTKLSEKDVGLIEGKAGEMMTSRGYALSGYQIIHPDKLQRKMLTAGNRWGRFKHALKRYGLFIALSDRLSRQVSHEGLQDFARKRVDEKTRDYLK